MKIPEAIKILETHGVTGENTTWGDYLKAVELGIEALRLIKVLQDPRQVRRQPLLPGQTKD